ncbi:hypothetical protein TNCV_2945251 [Trichonephila clavipes]|nr:hypothetical protein TNCV_2945251 [Trichonephila clavipes]
MKSSTIFSSGEDSMRITFSGTFRLITEKKSPSFLHRPRLRFSASKYLVFPDVRNQRDAPDWTSSVKISLCKMAVDCLPGKSRSRHTRKVTSKLMNVVHPCHRALNAK